MELLNKNLIAKYVSSKNATYLKNLEIFDSLPSTNTYLVEKNNPNSELYTICLAESQSAGKGRIGKNWVSPFGCNIYLSIRQRILKEFATKLSGLSLVIGIAVVEALKKYGIINNINLKWPNDILWKERKLAGILIEFYHEKLICNAIIGVGLNVNMPRQFATQIDQPWCDIAEITNTIPERNRLAGLLIDHILAVLSIFQESGLRPFFNHWQKLDITYDKKIILTTSQNKKIIGIGRGIDTQGNFLLEDQMQNLHAFSAAEISLSIYSSRNS